MSKQSLYRTYRPSTFAEVIGQEQVTKPLEDSIKSESIGHAYIFSGSRGLGKTSVARIFAKSIGCSERDLYEIDAASNNSVEDIRTLTEGVYTLPFESPYKVYLLDEVHMLSKGAWNAFLKTLEEPPAYAVFIMATTELQKVPDTVQSRCQVFDFKKPSRAVLAKMVIQTAKKEGHDLEQDAGDLIAMLAEGSYRDALSILQKVLSSATNKKHTQNIKKVEKESRKLNGEFVGSVETIVPSDKLVRETIEQLTGAPKREQVHELISALAKGERAKALVTIEETSKSGIDMKIFLELILETLRNTLLLRYAPELKTQLARDSGSDELVSIENFAKEKGITHETMLAFLTASDRIRYAPIPSLPLELAVLELMEES